MEAKERANCLRIFILVVDFIKEGLTNLVEFVITKRGITFEDFINQHQHDIYHHCYNSACCQCPLQQRYSGPTKHVLHPTQLDVLFDKHGQKLSNHNSRPNDVFCCSKAKPGLCEKDIDVTLARFLVINYCTEVFWHPFNTFEDFLNAHKHDIFHMCCGNLQCCLCIVGYQYPTHIPSLQNDWTNVFRGRCPPCANCLASGSNYACSVSATSGITSSPKMVRPIFVQKLVAYVSPLGIAVHTLTEIRNSMLGHKKDVRITDSEFELTWSKTQNELMKISNVCCPAVDTHGKLDSLKERTLDETILKQYQIILQEESLKKEELKEEIKNVCIKVETLTDYVVKHQNRDEDKLETVIEGQKEVNKNVGDKLETVTVGLIEVKEKQIDLLSLLNSQSLIALTENGEKRRRCEENSKSMLEVHTKDGIYVPTRGQQAAMRHLQDKGMVVITGPPGAGKSSMGKELQVVYCSTFQDYIPIILDKVTDWMDIINVKDKVIVFLDDIFGRTNCNYDDNIHSNILDNFELCIKTGYAKVIITMRESIQNACKKLLNRNSLLSTSKIVNLGSEFYMNVEEKLECLQTHCAKNEIEVIDGVESYYSATKWYIAREILTEIVHVKACQILAFPEACKLFTTIERFFLKGLCFFKGANIILVDDIKDISQNHKVKYAVLIFVLLNDSRIDISDDMLTNNLESINQLLRSVSSTDVASLTNGKLNEVLQELKGSYLIPLDTNVHVLTFQHRAIFEAVLLTYKREIGSDQTKIIKLMDLDFIMEMARPDNYEAFDGEVCITLSKSNYRCLATHLLDALFRTHDKYDWVARFMRSPMVMNSGNDLIEHMINENSEHDVSNIYESLAFTHITNYINIIGLHFQLTVAMFLFCFDRVDDKPTLKYLQNEINKKLINKDNTNLRNLIVDVFFRLILDDGNDKTLLMSEMIKQNKVHFSNWKNPVTFLYLQRILNDTVSLTVLCSVMDDEQTDNINFIMGEACNEGLLEAAQILLNVYDHLNVTEEFIKNACDSENVELVKLLLGKFDPHLFNAGSTLKEVCSQSDNEELVSLLLQTFTYQETDITTAFNTACRHRHVQVVKLFTKMFNESTLDFKTGITEACLSSDPDIYRLSRNEFDDLRKGIKEGLQNSHGHIHLGDFFSNALEKSLVSWWTKIATFARAPEDFPNSVLAPILGFVSFIKLQNDFEIDVSVAVDLEKEWFSRISTFFKVVKKRDSHQMINILSKSLFDKIKDINKDCIIYDDTSFSKCCEVNIDTSSYFQEIPELTLSYFHDITIEELLLDNFDHKHIDITTAMNAACKRQNVNLVKLFLEKFDDDQFDVNSAMDNALELCGEKIVKLLLEKFDHSLFDLNVIRSHFYMICEAGDNNLVTILLNTFDNSEFDWQRAFSVACRSLNSKVPATLIDFIVKGKFYENLEDETCIKNKTGNVNALTDSFKSKRFNVKIALIVACQFGKDTVVRQILDKFDHNLFDKNRAMICACREGKIAVVELLVEAFNNHTFDYQKVFYFACLSGQLPVLKFLIDRFDKQMLDPDSSVTAACKSGEVDMVQFVLETFDRSLVDEKNAFNAACRSGKISMVEFVFDRFDKKCIDTKSAMNEACRSGEVNVAKLILDIIGTSCVNKMRALNEACTSGNIEMVKFVLDRFGLKYVDEKSVMNAACRSCKVEMVRFVLNSFDKSRFDKTSAINEACRSGNVAVVDYILEIFGQRYIDEKSALNAACKSRKMDMVKFVLQKVCQGYIDEKSALNAACGSGSVKMVKFALDTFGQSNVDMKNAMDAACREGNVVVMECLLDTFGQGAVDVRSAMNEVCRSGYVSSVRYILKTFGQSHLDAKSAIYAACKSGEVDVLKFVIDSFAENRGNEQSPMNEAYKLGNAVDFFLKQFDQNQIDLKVAMIYSCESDSMDVLKFFLATFDHNIFDVRRALCYAFSSNKVESAQTLINWTHYCSFDVKLAMTEACAKLSVDIVEFVLSKYDAESLDLNLLMKQACVDSNIPLIYLLIKSVEHSFLDVKTASIAACENGNLQVVKVLLEKKNPLHIDLQSVYDAAIKIGDIDIASYIFQFVEILYERNKD